METSNTLRDAWSAYWVLRKVRPEPAWARLLISTAIGLTFMFALLLLGGLLRGHLPGVAWLRATMPSNLILCLSVSYTIYLRGGFSQLQDGDVTLDAELDMAQSYLRLLQIRMMERLTFEIDVAPELGRSVLPPLLLQPLVENAIVHGLESNVEGGHIHVSAHLTGKCLEIAGTITASDLTPAAGQGVPVKA